MTRDVLSVTEETPVADIAVLLETNRIKRVPVLRSGKLTGIVSRANLVRALAMTITEAAGGAEIDDRAIRDKLLAELKAQKWAEVSPANVTVKDGVVHLWSSYLSEQEKLALVVAAENIPGVPKNNARNLNVLNADDLFPVDDLIAPTARGTVRENPNKNNGADDSDDADDVFPTISIDGDGEWRG